MKSKTIIGIVVFIVVLIGVYFGYQMLSDRYQDSQTGQNTKDASSTQKTLAPDFIVYDGSGKEVKLSDFKGKPVILNFWASWCPPCKGEMPGFQNQYLTEKDNVAFVMVDLVDGQRETKAQAQQFLSDNNYTFPVYFDEKQEAANAYTISSIPTTIVIDAQGYIIQRHTGSMSESALQSYIQTLKK